MLELRDLTVCAGIFSVKQSSLRVEKGACHVLLGPTGSGKTIILETIAGLRRPESGAVFLGGRELTRLPPEKRNIAYVPQDLALFPRMSVRENIAYSLRVRGVSRVEQEKEILPVAGLLGIDHILERGIRGLSGGERQRVALARALLSQSELFLLDEPLSSLDVSLRRELWYVLKEIRQTHRPTLLLVTHDLDEALFLGDTVSVIAEGAFLQTGEISAVYRAPRTVEAAKIVGVENFFQGLLEEVVGERVILSCPDLNLSLSVSRNAMPLLPPQGTPFTIGIRASGVKVLVEEDQSGGAFFIEAAYEKGLTAVTVLRSRQGANVRIVAEEPGQTGRPARIGQGADISFVAEPFIFFQ